jgi:hypothetical protein
LTEIKLVNYLVENTSPIAILDGIKLRLEVQIDPDAEKIRISKEIEKNTKELEKLQLKLVFNMHHLCKLVIIYININNF